MTVFTVSEVNQRIKKDIQEDQLLWDIYVRGEVSRISTSNSGHTYFTLKDQNSELSCAIFKNVRESGVKIEGLKEGAEVLVRGRVEAYPPKGRYTLIILWLKPLGEGEIYLKLEALKKRLEEEGLFAPEKKKTVPLFPFNVGVVTAPEGAALQDIINVLRRRWPVVHVIISPTIVQGEGAGERIAEALKRLDHLDMVDVIILGRGGGSVEDLWCFNDEVLVRAIASCQTPVVSAVGHEIDFTLSDFVADIRAPTPSAAAEIIAPNIEEVRERISLFEKEMAEDILGIVDILKDVLSSLEIRMESVSPSRMMEIHNIRLDELEGRLDFSFSRIIEGKWQNLCSLEDRLSGVSLPSTLERGFSVILDRYGSPVRSISQVEMGDKLTALVHDGRLEIRIEGVFREASDVVYKTSSLERGGEDEENTSGGG